MKFLNDFSKNKKLFYFSLSLILAITLILIYQSKKNNSFGNTSIFIKEQSIESYFETYAIDLNTINNSLKKCFSNSSINIATTSTTLKSNIDTLSDIRNKVSSLTIEENQNPEIIPLFISAVKATEDLHIFCYNLSSYDPTLLQSDYGNKLVTLQANCINLYDSLSKYNIDIHFSDDSLKFFSIFYGHINNYNKTFKENSVKELQNSDFMAIYNSTLNDFTLLLEDLQPAIAQIHSDGRSLDVLLSDLKSKEIEFISIKSNFNNTSIPIECISYYNSLNNIFSLYSTYLNTMRTAIIYEMSSSGYEENKKQIDSTYTNAFSKYDDIKSALSSLLIN